MTAKENNFKGINPDAILVMHDLLAFVPFITPQYIAPRHLTPFINIFNRISAGEECFILLSIPPRHGKTETLIRGIVQYLWRNQNKTVVYSSYAQRQSESKTIKAHRMLRQLNVPLDDRMQNRDEFRLAGGGGLLTTGVGGALTGQGADLLVIDDPIKNREEAESIVYRNKVWEWFSDVAETRIEPGGSIIVCMTRWHYDDLVGRIAKQRRGYISMRIPAIADNLDFSGKEYSRDVLGRANGEALWPDRYDVDKLNKIKTIKPFTFQGLYQGLPQPREKQLFDDPVFIENDLPESLQYHVGADLAYTKGTKSNYSAVVVLATSHVTDKIYLVYVSRWQEKINETLHKLKVIQERFPVEISLESNGPQSAVCDMLENENIRINRLYPTTDKYTRSLEFAEAWNSKRILIPKNIAGVNTFLSEVSNFTGISDSEDDQIDAAVWAYESTKRQIWFSF